MTMATAEFVEEMAARQQTAVGPYIFEVESDPEQQGAPEESQQPRMNIDVSQWLVVNFATLTLHLCYCRLANVLQAYWSSALCCYR